MPNILDYLDWRGDLSLGQSPFNEVDNLILAELSYADFGGIVGGPEQDPVPMKKAAEEFFRLRGPDGGRIDMGVLVPSYIPALLKKAGGSARFGDMLLSQYVNIIDDENTEQFSAVTVDTGDGSLYLSFRGTDDTIAGWKEDFLMGCLPEVPAQKKAVQYTENAARLHPRRKLLLGGHSKGGNLAVYAGCFCRPGTQKRIGLIYNNDGPGFDGPVIKRMEQSPAIDRVLSIVPKSSIVGMLLEHEEGYTVIDSSTLALMQHDGFSWEVLGNRFVEVKQVSKQSRIADIEMKEWLHALTPEQRNNFVDALFTLLSSSGAKTLSDLREDSFRSGIAMITAMSGLDRETRDILLDFLRLLLKGNLSMVVEGIGDGTKKRFGDMPARLWNLNRKKTPQK